MAYVDINAELRKFKEVVDKRKTPGQKVGLFGLLKISTKFEEVAKPTCYKFLMEHLGKVLPDGSLKNALEEMLVHEVLEKVRPIFKKQADDAMALLACRYVNLQATDKESLKTALGYLTQVGYRTFSLLEHFDNLSDDAQAMVAAELLPQVSMLKDYEFRALIGEMVAQSIGQCVRDNYTEEEADAILGSVAKIAFTLCSDDPQEMLRTGHVLVKAGVGYDYGHCAGIASQAGLSEERVGQILDDTFYMRYPGMGRNKQPQPA